jgi:hypothetical protein
MGRWSEFTGSVIQALGADGFFVPCGENTGELGQTSERGHGAHS